MVKLDDTLGAVVIGFTFSTMLYGMAVVQFRNYFNLFPTSGEKTYIRPLVLCVLGLVTLIQGCITAGVYDITVTLFGSPKFLSKFPIGFDIAIIGGAILNPLIQFYFIRRAWIATQQNVFCALISILLLLRVAGSFGIGIKGFLMTDLHVYLKETRWLFVTVLAISAVVDISIASLLCYDLYQKRGRSLRQTIALLDQMIIWTVETGLITSTNGIIVTICFFTMSNGIWITFYILLPGLFTNSFLAALNGRASLRSIMSSQDGVLTMSGMVSNGGRTTNTIPVFNNLSIGVTTATNVMRDDDLEMKGSSRSQYSKP